MAPFIKILEDRLQDPLPGLSAQKNMANFRLDEEQIKKYSVPQDHKKAAVMALVYPKHGLWHTALMQRPESPYAHSKQVSFPGGGLENSDAGLMAAALRETEEEFGINRSNIQVLGALSELYIFVSNYLVAPYVGYLPEAPTFTPDPYEVAEIIEIPLHYLLEQERKKRTTIKTSSGYVLKDVPYYHLEEKVVWGATAMMLSEWEHVLRDINFSQ